MDTEKAISLLRQRLIELDDLASVGDKSYDIWRAKVLADLRNIFPKSNHAENMESIWYPRHIGGYAGASQRALQRDFEDQKNDSIGLLEGAIHEIAEYWGTSPAPHSVTLGNAACRSRKVFVVHGHDAEMRAEVVRILERLELEPVVLAEEASEGRTIIEKFESKADVGYAVVLYSPDDECVAEGATRMRPRGLM